MTSKPTTTTPPQQPPEKCACCGGVHDEADLIGYEVFLPDPNTPKAELFEEGVVCDICGETRSKYRSPIAAKIVYWKWSTGEIIREDNRCEVCFEQFLAKRQQRHIEDYV
jgi:hypothetical protein